MAEIPKKDITGECEGECRDRVKEGEKERQKKIKEAEAETTETTPRPPDAGSRNEPPGSMGGHV